MNTDDCQDCLKISTCKVPCLYIELVQKLAGKHKSIRERLAPPDINQINNIVLINNEPVNRDYKQILIDRKEQREQYISTTIKEIREIHEPLRKAVAAMLYADLSIREISIIIDKSERTVRRICGKT